MQYYASVAGLSDYLTGRGLTGEDAQYARLGYVRTPFPGHEQMAGRLAIPYMTSDGVVRDIRFRRIGDSDSPKYLSLAGNRPRLFEARVFAHDPHTVLVCEGELDTLVARRALGVPAVGIPGASAWKGNAHWRTLLGGPELVIVLADGDEAGRGMAAAISRDLEDTVRVVPMPEGMDVTDVVLAYGEGWLRDRVFGKQREGGRDGESA